MKKRGPKAKRLAKNKHVKALWLIVIGIVPMWFLVHTCVIAADGLTDRGEKGDFAVVLGNRINVDGTLSHRLEARLECAISLYQNRRVGGIIVSGADGKEGFLEGERARDYLRSRGIPDYVIFVDNDGGSSRRTVDNVLAMRERLHFNSLIVVTQYFHVTRCKMLFRHRGFENVSSVAPEYFEMRDFWSVPREFFQFYTQL